MTDDCGGGWRNRAGVMCSNNDPLWADTERGSAQVAGGGWPRRYPMTSGNVSAGDGSKGQPLRLGLVANTTLLNWLLVRRRDSPEDLVLFWYGNVSLAGTVVAALGGSSKTPSRRPSRRWGWTSTKCACGSAGTGTSPWRCWPMPFWR